MPSLLRRIAALEGLTRAQEVQPCIVIHQYRGETVEDALRAEGHEGAGPGRLVIVFRRDQRARDAAQGDRR